MNAILKVQQLSFMKKPIHSVLVFALCTLGAVAQTTEPTSTQIWLDMRLWKQIVGEAVPYVPPKAYPRPIEEFYAYKNAAVR